MNNKSDIIERIQKLFAMGDSSRNPNEEEVKTALAMAMKLMHEHNLSLSDVQLKQEQNNIKQEATNEQGKFHLWERTLASLVGKLFDCRVVEQGISYYPRKRIFLFIGFPQDVIIAKNCYEYLHFNIKLLAGLMAKHKMEFYAGIIAALDERVMEEIQNRTPEENNACKAIVCIKKDIVTNWINKNLTLKTIHRRTRNYDSCSADFLKGRLAGESLDLNLNKKLETK
jgi:hypothetical protein